MTAGISVKQLSNIFYNTWKLNITGYSGFWNGFSSISCTSALPLYKYH